MPSDQFGNRIYSRMLNRRGNRVNLPQPLEPAELGWATDVKKLYIGLDDANALPIIDLYEGVGLLAEAENNINNKMLEFNTVPFRLSTVSNISVTGLGIFSEEGLVDKLDEIPSSLMISENNRQPLNNIENNLMFFGAAKSTMNDLLAEYGQHQYVYAYDWAKLPNVTATASASILFGNLVSVNIIDYGLGYYSTVPNITITGDGSNAAASATISNGRLSGINIDNSGSGYTTLSITIDPPELPGIGESALNYIFTFHMGILDLNDGTEITNANLKSIQDGIIASDIFYDCGVVGVNAYSGLDTYQKSYAFVDNVMTLLSTPRATANIAGIINRLSADSYISGLVNVRQNVEILTSLSGVGGATTDEVVLTFVLAPSAVLVDIYSVENGYLAWDTAVTENQVVEYALGFEDSFCRTGRLNVSTLNASLSSGIVGDDYVDSRDGVLPVDIGGPDFNFYAHHDTGDGFVYLRYCHDFPDVVTLRVHVELEWQAFPFEGPI